MERIFESRDQVRCEASRDEEQAPINKIWATSRALDAIMFDHTKPQGYGLVGLATGCCTFASNDADSPPSDPGGGS